ncbi:MAG: response regulator [Proteobacteria bacterium]|nr:response regulator [Pseudomonadota bacterium]
MSVFINLAKSPIEDAIHSVAVKKSNPKDWAYLHVKIDDVANAPQSGDVERALVQKFVGLEMEVFNFAEQREIMMIADNRSRQAMSVFNRAIFDRVGGGALKLVANDLTEKGMEQVSKILGRLVPEGDSAVRVSLARMSRPSNCILILDDDPMVLKTMEFALKGFGYVGTTAVPNEFLAMYKEYAPNIVFVDIHLKGFKGTNIVNAIRRQFDPQAYAVMISADATKDTVMSVRECGAKGYIVKPVSRDAIYVQIMKAPTFVSKAATA